MLRTRARAALATSHELPRLDDDSALALSALAERGVDATPQRWRDPDVEWSSFDAIVLRSVWDYFHHPTEFAAWIDRVARVAPLWNPAPVVRWNAHKSYLSDLAGRGIPTVDTIVLPQGTAIDLAHTLLEQNWQDAVFKPAVGGGALGLRRVCGVAQAGEAQPQLDGLLSEGDVLVQPFLPSIVEDGELSLVYFGGALSHSLVKEPKPGDIRVQPQHGGRPRIVSPPSEALAVANEVLRTVEADLLYARVDLVRAHDGSLRLIELEVIEPLLFLGLEPGAAGRFADAFAARIGR